MEKAELISEAIELQRRLTQLLGRQAIDVWMNLNLTIAQLKSLFFIASEGSTNLRRVASALGVTPSNITGIVDRLVEQGLVSRQENPEDRRMFELRATDKGKMLLTNLWERRTGYISEILARMNTQQLFTLVQGLSSLVSTAEISEGENKDGND